MFLEKIAAAGLLRHDPDTNVLAPFPLSVSRNLVVNIVSHLCDPSMSSSDALTALFPSQAHVLWAMECIGHGFRLPIADNVPVINGCLDIYLRWCSEEKSRPFCVNSNLEFFYIVWFSFPSHHSHSFIHSLFFSFSL